MLLRLPGVKYKKNLFKLFELLQNRVVSLRSKIGEIINNLLDKDMYLTTEKKQEFFRTFGSSELDTGAVLRVRLLFSPIGFRTSPSI